MQHRMASPALPLSLAAKWLSRLHLLTDVEAGRLLGLPDECIKWFVLDRFDVLVPSAASFMETMTHVFRVRRVLAGSSPAGRRLVGSRQFTAACLARLLPMSRECVVSAETRLYTTLIGALGVPAVGRVADGDGLPNIGMVVALIVCHADPIGANVRIINIDDDSDYALTAVLPASEPTTRVWERMMDVITDAVYAFIQAMPFAADHHGRSRVRCIKRLLFETIKHVAVRCRQLSTAASEILRRHIDELMLDHHD